MAGYKIAGVVLPIALDKEFDYSLCPATVAKKGMRVLVDLRGRKVAGIITSFKSKSNIKNLKPILDILDSYPTLNSERIRFAQTLSKFYPYGFGEFLFMMLPAYLKNARRLDTLPFKALAKLQKECRRTFVKADSFIQRYGLWRELLREKLKTGSVLICFPQISYLLEAKKIIDNDFKDKVKVIHSYENEKELFKNWQESRTNTLLLGTRLAIFYYPHDLNLIVVEEENSHFYFQEEKPFYHLLQVALLLSKLKNIDLILSADYPTLYTYQLIKEGKVTLQEIEGNKKEIKVIGIERQAKPNIVSPVLSEILRKNIAENKQSVIFLNRKGFGSVIVCSSCGHIFMCQRCSVSLRSATEGNKGICPYCTKEQELPKVCSYCNTGYLKTGGLGIERLEAALKNIFPDTSFAQWQGQALCAQVILSTSKIFSSLYSGQSFDAGFVLDIDQQMSRLDYEAVFEAFLYLKKLSLFLKNVFVFTHNAGHYLFDSLNKDWKSFYDRELDQRKMLNLPPFATIIKITLRAKKENKLYNTACILYNILEPKVKEIYGPFKEYPFRLRGKFRYTVIAKAKNGYVLRNIVKEQIGSLRSSHAQFAVIVR